jgi:hypothetical protein
MAEAQAPAIGVVIRLRPRADRRAVRDYRAGPATRVMLVVPEVPEEVV